MKMIGRVGEVLPTDFVYIMVVTICVVNIWAYFVEPVSIVSYFLPTVSNWQIVFITCNGVDSADMDLYHREEVILSM